MATRPFRVLLGPQNPVANLPAEDGSGPEGGESGHLTYDSPSTWPGTSG